MRNIQECRDVMNIELKLGVAVAVIGAVLARDDCYPTRPLNHLIHTFPEVVCAWSVAKVLLADRPASVPLDSKCM